MLIERERDLAALEARLERAAGGQGGTVVVEGAPGIGKTALLAEVRARAAGRGLRVLAAAGGEVEQDLPFGVVRQLFEPALRAAGEAGRADLMAGAASLAAPVFGPAPGIAGEVEQGGVVHGLYWLCCNLAERPLLLVVDDAHWADAASLRFVSHLARRLGDVGALLVLATRPRPGGDDALSRALSGVPPQTLFPEPLSEAGVGRVVRHELGAEADDEFCRACARATGGNPFLLTEALASLREDKVRPVAAQAARVARVRPDTVSRAVLARLARLGPPAAAVARAVAVLGAAAAPRRVAALAGLPVARVAELAAALVAEAILAPGRPLRFAHPLVRTAVYADDAGLRRAADHKRAALMLRDDGAGPEELAGHLLLSEPDDDPWVVGALREAAAGAVARNAPEPAVAFLRRALEEPPAAALRAPLHAELGRALGMANRPDEAGAALHRAIELTESAPQRTTLAMDLGWLMLQTGRSRAAIEAMEYARGLFVTHDGARPLELEAQFAMLDIITIRPPAVWLARLDPLLPSLGGTTDIERMLLSIAAFGSATTGDRPAADVAALARRSCAGPLPARDKWILVNMASAALGVADDLTAALELLDRGIDAAVRLGNAAEFRYLAVLRSHSALYAGHLVDAEGDGRAAIELQEDTRPQDLPLAAAVLIDALVARGDLAEAERIVRDGDLAGEQPMNTLIAHFLLLARGRLRLAQGRPAEAVDDLEACGRLLGDGGYANPNFAHWRTAAAQARFALGHLAEAAGLAAEDLALSRRFGAPTAIARALRVAARVDPGRDALARLEEAVALTEGRDALLERALALVDYGAALRRTGRRADAVAPLRQGLDLAARCAAAPLAARAGEELAAAGARPRRARLTGREALTAGELRVARLAASGATNREIAQALFLSVRTVEIHLTNTYRKLAIGSRQQLADALSA
ncbi:ATP-binding protein [Dactylosporangium sp. CA-139066]|uniref:ATP-binding protein n=1 Tax=Dactylosporangium sp. CA-139066 TaxID=3239930 RepID=UPI003D9204DC